MAERAPTGEGGAGQSGDELDVDWIEIENSSEFQELVRRRRSFVLPGTVFFLSYFMAFMLLTAYAPDFMGERVYEGLTVGYVLALTQFIMVFTLGLWYLRKADKEFDPLAERAIARYAERSDVAGTRAPEPQR
jgi:uncharacterized membrane protein (DUF485 family)